MPRRLLFVGLVVIAALVAYAVRPLIYPIVIVPIAYLWWVMGLYYHLVPQIIFWFLLIVVVGWIALRQLLIEIPIRSRPRPKIKDHGGPIEQLANLLEKQPSGVYYKWLLANRLGNLSRDLLDQREGGRASGRGKSLIGRQWNPPADVAAYLETGLNGSFADFPRSRRIRPTPLDRPAEQIIGYLEKEMELASNGNR